MSTAETLERRKPLVLLVEDVADSRKRRRELFESFDCTAVAVGSRKEAERELQQTPLVDLVVTDIHMPEHPSDSEDRSGIELAKHVKAHFSQVPVAGYSAYFEGDQLGEELAVFDVVLPKGSQSAKALEVQISECVDLAMRTRDRRLADVEERLDDLRRKYEGEVPSVEVVRRLALDPDRSHSAEMVEGPLGEAGYRLRLVSAEAINGAEPFVVWIAADAGGVQAEVYGRPELYAYGENEREALDGLAELMHLIAEDAKGAEGRHAPGVRALYEFLTRIFSGRRAENRD